MEWVLKRTATDLMGKLLLCWATVVLWVRAARGVEWHIGEDGVLVCCSLCGKTERPNFYQTACFSGE